MWKGRRQVKKTVTALHTCRLQSGALHKPQCALPSSCVRGGIGQQPQLCPRPTGPHQQS